MIVLGRHGRLTPVVDARGQELVLDRPTSLEFAGANAYVVSVTGETSTESTASDRRAVVPDRSWV
jgi:hypothetical protein